MSSDEECDQNDIGANHRKEKKELRAKILAMKKTAKSGNKQKQKETSQEIDRLEKEMEERHRRELAAQTSEVSEKKEDEVEPIEEKPEENGKAEEIGGFYKEIKVTEKAAKKQARKKAADERLKEAMKADRENSKGSMRTIELEIIAQILSENNFSMAEIAADGDCMYNAIAHQLARNGVDANGKKLRRSCADYMREHKDDFFPFIAPDDDEEEVSADSWQRYLDGVEKTAEKGGVWGGELELNALSRHLETTIEVLKTDGVRRYGEEFSDGKGDVLRIVYLRNAFKLGEHYNATVPNIKS